MPKDTPMVWIGFSSQTLDASLSYAFLKGRSRYDRASGFDLLQQRTSHRQRIANNSITNTIIDGVKSYVISTFSYRFNSLGGDVRNA